jgi:hypothetical protein
MLSTDNPGFSIDEYPSFYDSYKAYNMMLPKNNTELVNIFRKVVNLGHDFLGTAVDASKFEDAAQHTSVDPARRLAAFSAIFGT